MRYYLLTLILAIVLSFPAYSITLKWEIGKDERLEVVKTAKVKLFVNKKLVKSYDERNIVNLTCYEKGASVSRVKGDFSIFQKETSDDVFAGKLLETHEANFAIHSNGRYEVKKDDYMPNLRHIPTFPAGDVKQGDSWKGDVEILFNNFSTPFKLVFPAEYTLEKMKKEEGLDVAVIRYTFSFDVGGEQMSQPDFPKRIAGRNNGTIYWDVTNNHPMDMKDSYAIAFLFQTPGSSEIQELQMDILTKHTIYAVVTDNEKEKARAEIAKEIPKESGISVDTETRGIVLRLADVLFDFDSYALKHESLVKLNTVVDAIKKRYPDNELIIEGHTDKIGDTLYNQKLSEERALSVAKYLKKSVGHDKISYKGYGQTKPIADNSISEGRQKNRRVEIIIKMQ